MTFSVRGDNVSDSIVRMYVTELLKAHPGEKISSVDIIVEGDILKVRMRRELEKSA